MRTETPTVEVSTDAAARGGSLVAYLLDDHLELAAPEAQWEKVCVANARRIFGDPKVKRAVAGHGGSRSASTLALHTRATGNYPVSDGIRILAARALKHARDFHHTELIFSLQGGDGPAFAAEVVEGATLAAYRFARYFEDPGDPSSPRVRIVVGREALDDVREQAARALRIASEVNRARDLINEPAEAVTPETLAREAHRIAADTGLEVQVWNEKALQEKGYPGLISVGQGSHRPPRLIVLRHRPKDAAGNGRHLALVGKGITFDTGGISLKPPSGMWTMKGDMSGAAAVLAAMAALAREDVPATVTGIVATAENYPGPAATRPGDIFRARNGKSVMVDNTDAEGRLVLTDALARAGEEGATHIVDVATLTGAVVRALGTGVAGVMGNDSDWVRAVIEAGEPHGEVFWELPLVKEYAEELRCDSADLKNIGGINAGTITAALFLQEFVPEGAKWAHLDIAGPFIVEKPWKYYPKGATGFGVRTLFETAARFAEGDAADAAAEEDT